MSIQIRHLRKNFGTLTAVDDINIEIAEGKMLVLLGPSGCGKTTTMRCIAGLETPDSGRIVIAGRPVFDGEKGVDVAINQRNVGMVFQSYAIWPHMTVFDNVAFPLRMQKLQKAEIEGRVTETLKLIGLDQAAHRGASCLSGGQMQRVALARSLVMRPAVLLFDEPLSNLDARLRDRLRIQLRELQTEFKITSVYVTHDQQEALALADEIAVMGHGCVLQTGDPMSIYNRPKTSAIAEFLGYGNIFPVATSQRLDEETRITLDSSGRVLAAAHSLSELSHEVDACIRPEDIAIEPRTVASRTGNSIDGVVILASFMGAFIHYRVRLNEGGVMEIFSDDIRADLTIGTAVTLTVPPAAIRLLPRN
jgi:iron(III) transport system ATP-binding protein